MHHITGFIIGSMVGVTWFFILSPIAAVAAWVLTVYFITKKFVQMSIIEVEEEEEFI